MQRVPRASSALLLSADGLEPDTADHMAALSSALYAPARSLGMRMADSGGVRQVVVELGQSLLCVSRAGQGMCLAAPARREADAAVLGYEMAVLVKQVGPLPVTPARQSGLS